jgi:hypothetical protein
MAKLSRDDLKGIVKECLLEILSEGLNTSLENLVESKQANKAQKRLKNQINEDQYRSPQKRNIRNSEVESLKQRMKYLDTLKVGESTNTEKVVNQQFQQRVEQTTSSLTNDPILSEIFKDTAATTLQEQLSAESKSPATAAPAATDVYSKKVAQSNPEDLFGGEAASKWATLAFAEK